MVGAASLNPVQPAVNLVLDSGSTTPAPDPEKPSQSASNEREAPERINKVEGYGAAGVEKAEAAALVWSKTALWAIYAWYTIPLFLLQSVVLYEEPTANSHGGILGFGYPFSCWRSILRSAPTSS